MLQIFYRMTIKGMENNLLDAIKSAMKKEGRLEAAKTSWVLSLKTNEELRQLVFCFVEGWDDLVPGIGVEAAPPDERDAAIAAGLCREAAYQCRKKKMYRGLSGQNTPVIPLDTLEKEVGVARLAYWLSQQPSDYGVAST